MLAGIGTGLLTFEDVKKWQVLDEKIIPDEKNHKAYEAYFKLYKDFYHSMKVNMKKMTGVMHEFQG